jgi:hypothetical protein
MNTRLVLSASLTALLLAAAGGAGLSQTAPPPAAIPYVMGMGDMMNTLVQPRHTKLGLAGHAGNWPLANYALAEIRQAFANIAKAVPKFRGMPVGELADVALTAPLNAIEAAIKQQDPKKFATAYDQLGQGCNACHIELDHPYVVIKTPDASSFPDQDFGPRR